ncbi:MAG: hypothetical protein HYR84_09685 [Planctomycetes bacterium]|nr:hypothetical protein [Planctomycetota bacterium]
MQRKLTAANVHESIDMREYPKLDAVLHSGRPVIVLTALRSLRERTGHRMLAKKGDTRRMTELLDAGGTLCTLGDQDAGSRGLYVDFFGQPASTHKAIARLAQRSGAIIAVVGMQRTGGLFEFTFRIMDLIEATEYDEHPDAIFAITLTVFLVSSALEASAARRKCFVPRRMRGEPRTK